MRKLIIIIIIIILVGTTSYAQANKGPMYNNNINGIINRELSIKKIMEEELMTIHREKEHEKLLQFRSETIKQVPKTGTNMKSYMDYRKITNKSSNQYKLQQNEAMYTDNEGFRKIEDKFVVAVGTYYGEVGTHLQVELSSGERFDVIVGDVKDNAHTDSTNRQHLADGSVVEFIVDTNKLCDIVRKMGDCSYSQTNDLKGDIVKIIEFKK